MSVERLRTIHGTAVALRGDNVDTDRIIPARFLRAITFEGLEDHLFEDDIQQLAERGQPHPLTRPSAAGAAILLVNQNFGCGSSREHAPPAIRRRGFRAVIGESFSEIFFGNAVALGMPCVTAPAEAVAELMSLAERQPEASFELDLEALTVSGPGARHTVSLPSAAREAFIEGTWDATGLLLERYDEVEAVARRLPYMRWR